IAKVNLAMGDGLFSNGEAFETDNEYLKQWYAPKARKQLLCFRSLISNYTYHDVLKVILTRAARSTRLTTHFDLDFPKSPQIEAYYCYKHDRTCKPTDDALQFLNRYAFDTLARIKEYSKLRKNSKVTVIHGDARKVDFPRIDAVITSPPYVGLIDYHKQHQYAYELLGLKGNETLEIGASFKGNSQKAREMYIKEIAQVFKNIHPKLSKDGVVVIVVNDKSSLYENLATRIGYRLETKLTRHVNRRTGRRSTNFYEEVLIWRKV
ncbi:MAG TPA: class I SAM-dependent methyltransferase, partial [Candidatus Tripitaka sp. YC43]